MFAAVDGKHSGLAAVADTIKPSAQETLERSKEAGVEAVMITGDNKRTAEARSIPRSPGRSSRTRGLYPRAAGLAALPWRFPFSCRSSAFSLCPIIGANRSARIEPSPQE